MTRILSELLGAKEPTFHHGVRQLEQASGGAAADIRLTTDILHGAQSQLRKLELDPHDTTGKELYAALVDRVKEDNAVFLDAIHATGDSQHVSRAVERFVTSLATGEVYALKTSTAKQLLRKAPPKRAMKRLGYRSLESMLKHEPAALILTAAHLVESASWHKLILAAYRRVSVADFEMRRMQVLAPSNARWEALAHEYVLNAKQNVVGLRELGVVILLPMPALQLTGSALAMTISAIQAMNEVTAASTYLKLQQVRADFGKVVADVSRHEPLTSAEIAGSSLPWKVIHRYFAQYPEAYNVGLFEPHVQPGDLVWRSAEDILSALHPRFDFWRDSAYLAHLAKPTHEHGQHGRAMAKKRANEPVSMNLMDSVLNLCNMLPYERRLVHYFREHVWNELMLRYMRQANIERAVHQQLGDELVGSPTIM